MRFLDNFEWKLRIKNYFLIEKNIQNTLPRKNI